MLLVFGRARNIISSAVALTFFASSAGCVDFERETMVFVFPSNVPEVRGLLVYEGLGVDGKGADDLQKATEQFTRIVTQGDEFCLGDNWILHQRFVPDADDTPEQQRVKEFWRRHLVVRNGALFRNAAGKLCAYQTLTIRDANKFVDELNGHLCTWIAEFANGVLAEPEKRDKNVDEETIQLIKKAAESDFRWVDLEPGRINIAIPATDQTIRNVKRELLLSELTKLQDIVANGGQPQAGEDEKQAAERRLKLVGNELVGLTASAKLIADLPLSLDHGHNRVTISFGVGSGNPMRFTTPENKKKTPDEKELLKLAKSLKVPFREDLKPDTLIEEFINEKGVLRRR